MVLSCSVLGNHYFSFGWLYSLESVVLMAKITEAKKKANKKWNDKNKDKNTLYNYRSKTKKFILEMASKDDLEDIKRYVLERRGKIKE